MASIIYATTLTTTPRIVVLATDESNLLRDIGVYEESFKTILGKSVLSYSKLTINTLGLADEIERQHPELSNVSISLPLVGRKPVVQVRATKPVFILASKQGTFLMSADGRAILRTQDTSISGLGITTVTDETGLEASPGKIVMTSEDIDFITTVLHQLKAKDITVQSVTLPAISNELHIRFQGRQYYAKFNLKGSALEQSGAFIAIQERLAKEGGQASEYIDVRVEDRAYIK